MTERGDFKMGGVFLFLGLASIFPGLLLESVLGKFVAFSSTFAFLAVAAAYIFSWPGLLGKKRAGGLLISSYLLFWPYHALNYLSLALFRWSGRSRPFNEVAPGLYLGGRPFYQDARSLNELNINGVLDLTCEFGEVGFLRKVPAYLCIPLLDRTAPSLPQLRVAIAFIRERMQLGPVLVHCALGHGRSATVVLAYLISTGKFADLKSALAQLKSIRPGIRINTSQLRILEQFAA